jgi:hypothetical protein
MIRPRQLIRFYDELGEIWLNVPSSAARSRIGSYHNAVDAYLTEGDINVLRPFRGKAVRDDQGKLHPFVTNPRILNRLARMGALFGFEDIYKFSS